MCHPVHKQLSQNTVINANLQVYDAVQGTGGQAEM